MSRAGARLAEKDRECIARPAAADVAESVVAAQCALTGSVHRAHDSWKAQLKVKKPSKAAVIAPFAAVAMIGAMLSSTAPAQAAAAPASAPHLSAAGARAVSPAATCDPKLDYEYQNAAGAFEWSNYCGFGTWDWGGYVFWALRVPTYRVWLHQYADGSGLSLCLWSDDADVYMYNYASQYGSWVYTPGNIQLTDNSTPC
jgi:hypothetical protein